MSPKISIIVPVYKVEPYIHKCIDSILNQTFKEFELILVDDGSPDNCGNICDEYAKKDNRVRVIHKENGGISSARNIGLDVSNGEYIGFVDSDDYIKLDMYERLYNSCKVNNADISIIGTIEVDENGKKLYEHIPDKLDFIEVLKRAHIWNKLFHRRLFVENNLIFREGKYYEDLELLPKLFIKSKKSCVVNNIGYVYLQRSGSTTREKNEKILDMLWAYKELKSFMIKEDIYKEYEEEFFIGVRNFTTFFLNILRECPTKFIVKNSKYIIDSFKEIDEVKIKDILIFFIKHIKTRILLKYIY